MNLGAPCGLVPAECCAAGVLVLERKVSEGWREFSGGCCLDEGSWNKGTVSSSCNTSFSSVPKSPTRNLEKISSSSGPWQASLVLCFPEDSQRTKSSTCFVTNWMLLAVCCRETTSADDCLLLVSLSSLSWRQAGTCLCAYGWFLPADAAAFWAVESKGVRSGCVSLSSFFC